MGSLNFFYRHCQKDIYSIIGGYDDALYKSTFTYLPVWNAKERKFCLLSSPWNFNEKALRRDARWRHVTIVTAMSALFSSWRLVDELTRGIKSSELSALEAN